MDMLTGITAKKRLQELLSESSSQKYKLQYQAEMSDDNSYGCFFDNNTWFCYDNRGGHCIVHSVPGEACALAWLNGQVTPDTSAIMELSVQLAEKALIDFYCLPMDELLYYDGPEDSMKLKEEYIDQYNKFYDHYYDRLINLMNTKI